MSEFRDFDYFGNEGRQRGHEFWKEADIIAASIGELARLV
jgi:hypothetical protein